MIEIKILAKSGAFAENKDAARELRIKEIAPALKMGKEITINFQGVESATQSFVHALISDLIRQNGSEVLDKIFFKNCNEKIQKIISIVTDYMQEGV